MNVISGQFGGRVFSNWQTLYHVFRFQTENERTIDVIFKGSDMPQQEQEYTLQGNWSRSDVYGWQFHARKIEPRESYRERHAANMAQLQAVLSL